MSPLPRQRPPRSAEERELARQALEAQRFLAEHGDELPAEVVEALRLAVQVDEPAP